jgi:hypothetical protein
MTHKYEPYLKKLADIMNGWEAEANGLRPPCSDQDIADLRERSRIVLSVEIPDQYADFLRITNGFEFAGFTVYASRSERTQRYQRGVLDGFVEMNVLSREFPLFRDYLYFAESGMGLYAYNLNEDRYEEQDPAALDRKVLFPSFDDMILSALSELCEAYVEI